MATDNAVMRYKDIKYYNEKLQDSMPSGGGVSSLADLGITLSADEINNLPNRVAETVTNEDNNRILYSDTTVTFDNLNDTITKAVNTYIESNYKILGGIMLNCAVPVVVSYCIYESNYYPYSRSYYAYVRLYHSTTGGSSFTATLRTLYRKK